MSVPTNFVLSALAVVTLAFAACGGPAGEQTEPAAAATVASAKVDAVTGYIDPACQMKVAEDASITHTHEGVTYGFCGEGCKTAFVADPASFLASLEE